MKPIYLKQVSERQRRIAEKVKEITETLPEGHPAKRTYQAEEIQIILAALQRFSKERSNERVDAGLTNWQIDRKHDTRLKGYLIA